MTLSDRIELQTKANGSKLVRVPAQELLELMKKAEAADAYKLKADAYDREERRLRRRREAITEPRRRSIASMMLDQDQKKDRV